MEWSLSAPDLQQACRSNYEYTRSTPSRRRRLYQVILRGFEKMVRRRNLSRDTLSNESPPGCKMSSCQSSCIESGYVCGELAVDGHGAGYVVWLPCQEQQHEQRLPEHKHDWTGDADEEFGEENREQAEKTRPIVAYGGGYDGLFTGGLERAIESCDCTSPPLRWVRVVLELLPPPEPLSLPSTARHSDRDSPFTGAFGTSRQDESYSNNAADNRKTRGYFAAAAPHGSSAEQWKAKNSGTCLNVGTKACITGDTQTYDEEQRRGKGPKRGKRDRRQERNVDDLWWLTDPPPPKVSAGTFHLRIATETVEALPTDIQGAPNLVCGIEVCEDRRYAAGRLDNDLGVASPWGPYRLVHSYRVPVMLPRSSRFHEQPSRRDSLHTRRKRPSAGPRHGPDERSQLNERGSPTPMDRRRSSLESWSNQSSVKFRESSLPLSSPTSAAEEVDGSLFTSLRSAVAEAAASRKSGRWSSPSSPIPSTSAACSRWESVNRDEEERAPIRTDKRALEEKEENVIIVTDVKAGYWYSVRQRFSWAIGGGDTVEEVVSGRRCVHTKLHTRQVTPPSRPRATVVCLRHQDRRTNHSDGDAGGGSAHGGHLVGTSPEKRAVAVERGHNEREQGLGGGLLFRLEIRWDGGGRSEGMGGTRGAARGAARDSSFARGQSPQETEYVLQGSVGASRASSNVGAAPSCSRNDNGPRIYKGRRASKASRSSPAIISRGGRLNTGRKLSSNSNVQDGDNIAKGGDTASRNSNVVKDSPYGCPSHEIGTILQRGGNRHPNVFTTSEPFRGKDSDGTSNGDKSDHDDNPAADPRCSQESQADDGYDSSDIVGDEDVNTSLHWSKWRTVCNTKARNTTVEVPHAVSVDGVLPASLRYRVGAKVVEEDQRLIFSEALEIPGKLLRCMREIEDLSSTGGKGCMPKREPSTTATEEVVQNRDGRPGLTANEATNFMEAFALSADDDAFPACIASELQSKLWKQDGTEVFHEARVDEGTRVMAEVKSIQRALHFPVNPRFVAGIICGRNEAVAGG